MAEIVLLADRLIDSVEGLQDRLYAKPWVSHSRVGFLHSLKGTIVELDKMLEMLKMLGHEFSRQGLKEAPDVKAHITGLESLLELMQRNKGIEERYVETAREAGDVSMLSPAPELYADIERKVLAALLKTQYLAERVQIFERKTVGYAPGSEAVRSHAMKLLEDKENELQELRQKYHELKRNAISGSAQGRDANALELGLWESARKLESENAVLREGIEDYGRQFERMSASKSLLESRFRKFEDTLARHTREASELIALLKRERDTAQKLIIGAEAESLRLRSAYSRGILSLEGEKIMAKENAVDRVSKRMRVLEKEVKEKEEMLRHFQDMFEEKQKEIERLREKPDQKGKKKD